ncbi:MAG TPA: winged helix-turn-helix domain-containing protein [Candidatus Methanoperedens sp.]
MQENPKDLGNEKLLILPLGEESKKITQVISNDTARQIIELLADAPLSASDIAERLQSPLTTIAYNLENLESVGLIRVERIKYSEKGREVKIYAPVRKLIVVVPEKTDRKSAVDILRKYLGVTLAAVAVSSIIEFLMLKTQKSMLDAGTLSQKSVLSESVNAPSVLNETAKSLSRTITPTPTPVDIASGLPANVTQPTSVYGAANINMTSPGMAEPLERTPDIFEGIINTIAAHPAIVFLFGCLFVIALLILLDLHRKDKK